MQGDPLNSDTKYLYMGQQYDYQTELYSLRARYYDPSLGRFMSRDTWAYDYQNPVELNRYVYVSNNPTKYVDPSGNNGIFIGYGKQNLEASQCYGSPQNPGPCRRLGAVVGGVAGGMVGGILAGLRFMLASSGACGDAAKQAALANPSLSIALGVGVGAVAGALVGYFSYEILGNPQLQKMLFELNFISAMASLGVSGLGLVLSGGESLPCFAFDFATSIGGLFLGGQSGGMGPIADVIASGNAAALVTSASVVLVASNAINLVQGAEAAYNLGILFSSNNSNTSNNNCNGVQPCTGTQTGNTAKNARLLERNMATSGNPRPGKGYSAHHIVQSTESSQNSINARNLLARFGIDINSENNGVWLLTSEHGRWHTGTYRATVYNRLNVATTQQEATSILNDIGQEILAGTFPR